MTSDVDSSAAAGQPAERSIPAPPGIDGFEIERRLSHHVGVSTLYAARDLRRGGDVALRVLAAPSADPDAGRLLDRAIALRRGIDDVGLVPLLDAGRAPAGDWVTAPLMAARSLSRLLGRERRLAPERALAILEPVASALDAAHARGLVCDRLTAHGVLVDVDERGRERGVLTDVGPPWPARMRPGRLLGDVEGLAPEEIWGDPPTPAANVYSLGAVLVRCLTGEPPFPAASRPAMLRAHLVEPPPRPSERVATLSPALDDVIARALAKDPRTRPGSAGELIAAAVRALSAEPAAPPSAERHADAGPPVVSSGERDPAHSAARTASRPAPAPAAPRSRASRAVRALLVAMSAVGLIGIAVVVAAHPFDGARGQPDTDRDSPTVATATLGPPTPSAASKATGAVRVVRMRGRLELTISGRGLAPQSRNPADAYFVWLFNSRRDAQALGFVVPPIGATGTFANHRFLPPGADRYREIIVTREHGAGARPAGPIILEARLPLPER
jgi:serine/threonine kinase PknH